MNESMAQRPDETRKEWKDRTFMARYGSGGEHQRPAPVPQPGHPHPGVAELQKLAEDLNGDFDRDEVELGLPKRTPHTRLMARLGKVSAPLNMARHAIPGLNLAQMASDTANLQRVKAALAAQELEDRIAEVYAEPQLHVSPAPIDFTQLRGSLTNFAKLITGGDSVPEAVGEERCIKPPLGCGEPIGRIKGLSDPLLPVLRFRDEATEREWRITGMCQPCQDKMEEESRRTEDADEYFAVDPDCEGPCCG